MPAVRLGSARGGGGDSLNQPMFVLLNMWVGGWTYDPDSATPSMIETQVDYVQVWQK